LRRTHYRTWAEPLALILHIAYAFIPLGFLLLGLGILQPGMVSPSGALHGWTAGAVGVMTRATRGHTGQDLTAAVPMQAIYAFAVTSALARIFAAFDIQREPMLAVSATAWCLAFGGFLIVYGPFIVRPRR
jgi:uncharacterized protein involved in response to NO